MDNPVFIVVITDTEYRAVASKIQLHGEAKHIGHVTLQMGEISGVKVVLGKFPGMGSKTAGSVAVSLSEVIIEAKPSCVIEVGICFSLKSELKIGDVCVCSVTADYEYQKLDNGNVKHRSRTINSSKLILPGLSHHALVCDLGFGVHTGVYACGDKVVNDGDFKGKILGAIPDAMAGDMESYPLALVCENHGIPWAVIKASSDDGINKHDFDQERAASNAITFLVDFLDKNQSLPGVYAADLEVNTNAEDVNCRNITREITKREEFRVERLETSRYGVYVHYHPEMADAWLLVYVYKALSIPEALRAIIRSLSEIRFRIDVCVISRAELQELRLESYKSQLKEAGFSAIYVNTIKEFLFDRVVKEMKLNSSAVLARDYVDQKIYSDSLRPVSGRNYARSMVRSSLDSPGRYKPISVILGDGGIGKTTLCASIVNYFHQQDTQKEQLLLISKSDILRAYDGGRICSIVDLYREYRRGSAEGSRMVDDAGFELALSSGSIVVIVDGIDEIESAVGGRFDMDSFVSSIDGLNRILGSCKVFLTSRPLGGQRFLELENADVMYLKGFSAEDVEEYLGKQSDSVASKVRRIIPRINTKGDFVNPYLLSVATQVFEDDLEDLNCDFGINFPETAHLDTYEPFEYMLARLLGREIEKQSLGVSVDDYYEALEYVVVDRGNSIPLEDFQFYISTMLSPEEDGLSFSVSSNYLKCLLFQSLGGRISIAHEEYVGLIRTKFAVNVLVGTGSLSLSDCSKFLSILSSDPNDVLGLRESLVSKISSADVCIEGINNRLAGLLDYFKTSSERLSLDAKRAIYSLHLLAFKLNGAREAAEAAVVLKKLHGGDRITHLYVFGAFNLVDFSGLVLENCQIIGFGRFLLCKFDAYTSFRRCRIENSSDRYGGSGCSISNFDKDCHLDDGVRQALNSMASREAGLSARYRQDLKSVLKALRNGLGFTQKSLNKIKQGSNLSSGLGYEEFFRELCRANILEADSSSGLYGVCEDIHQEALAFCEEGHVRGRLAEFIRQ